MAKLLTLGLGPEISLGGGGSPTRAAPQHASISSFQWFTSVRYAIDETELMVTNALRRGKAIDEPRPDLTNRPYRRCAPLCYLGDCVRIMGYAEVTELLPVFRPF